MALFQSRSTKTRSAPAQPPAEAAYSAAVLIPLPPGVFFRVRLQTPARSGVQHVYMIGGAEIPPDVYELDEWVPTAHHRLGLQVFMARQMPNVFAVLPYRESVVHLPTAILIAKQGVDVSLSSADTTSQLLLNPETSTIRSVAVNEVLAIQHASGLYTAAYATKLPAHAESIITSL